MCIKVMERHYEIAKIHRTGNPLIKVEYSIEVVSKKTNRRVAGWDETFNKLADAIKFLNEWNFK